MIAEDTKYEKPHISFVILHYMDAEITEKCIASIKKNIQYTNYSIVVVDNASPNLSGKYLHNKYMRDQMVDILLAEDNLGFAKGNNLGYAYARKIKQAQYIVVANNDVMFEQNEFAQQMLAVHATTRCSVLGPDIITPKGIHQSPLREKMFDRNELKKKLFIKQIFLYYFLVKKKLKIGDKIQILENMFEKKDRKNQEKKRWMEEQREVVLQGACIIYTPDFIQSEHKAFSSSTYMYGEEDLLCLYCKKKGHEVVYSPKIQVEHLNGESTEKSYENVLDKNIFMYNYIVKGYKILLKEMRRENVLKFTGQSNEN